MQYLLLTRLRADMDLASLRTLAEAGERGVIRREREPCLEEGEQGEQEQG